MRTDADQKCGKHDILPVAGASQDHAGVPVMLPRNFDADMRVDGSRTAQSVKTPPSMSAEECTAHQDSHARQGSTRPINLEQRLSRIVVFRRMRSIRSKRWHHEKEKSRLRGQDKARFLAAGTLFLSICLHIVFWRCAFPFARCAGGADPILSFLFNSSSSTYRTLRRARNRRLPPPASIYALRLYASIY